MGTVGLLPKWVGQLVSLLPFLAGTAVLAVTVVADAVRDRAESG